MTSARLLALACFAALSLAAGPVLASPPESADAPELPKPANRKLIAGGVLIGLGFAAELSGAVVSVRCTSGDPCAGGIAVALGVPDGPNRLTLVATGPSSTYAAGRLVAAPLLISGFTITMVGLASAGTRASSWSHATKRRVAWSLFGAGLGVLVVSRILRAGFARSGVCQEPLCVHGFDQTSLWVGRGLTFAGTGLLVRGAAKRTELGVANGPSNSFGLSLSGRF